MARVAALIPDLLFGSNVVGALRVAGHDVELISDAEQATGAEVVIIDLTADVEERLQSIRGLLGRMPSLAFYSHVESEVRDRARTEGVDVVVPRSRMAREAAPLVERLLTSR